MTLAELYRELSAHDWFYEMSDDPRVYQNGRDSWNRLLTNAHGVEGGDELMRNYSKHVYSGPAFGIPKHPKPEMPAEVAK